MTITLHIDRLVLEGLPVASGQASAMQHAVERELVRMLATGGLSPTFASGGAAGDIPGGLLQLVGIHDPHRLGARIAHAIYAGIGTQLPAT
jgi:hypothetical protein